MYFCTKVTLSNKQHAYRKVGINYNKLLMKFSARIILFTLIIFTLCTCKNKLNINAPYKEIPSIYAVLNPQEDIQIIRINKVFLGEGDANVMAQVADSVNYQPGDLSITLERYVNNVKTIASKNNNLTVSFHDSVITTSSGAFNKTQRVYVCSDRLFNSGEYRLKVTNEKTKAEFTAKANAVDSIHEDISTSVKGLYYPLSAGTPSINYINYSSTITGPLSFSYRIRDGKINQVKMRLHFYDSVYSGAKEFKFIDYPFTNQLSKNAPTSSSNVNLIGRLQLDFRSAELFSAFGVELAKMGLSNNIFGRRVYKIEYFIYSSTQDYADYLDYTTPSLSLAQQKPLYSNFDGAKALGIFTFRSTCRFSKETDVSFENDFAYNKNTCPYKFFKKSSTLPGFDPATLCP